MSKANEITARFIRYLDKVERNRFKKDQPVPLYTVEGHEKKLLIQKYSTDIVPVAELKKGQ